MMSPSGTNTILIFEFDFTKGGKMPLFLTLLVGDKFLQKSQIKEPAFSHFPMNRMIVPSFIFLQRNSPKEFVPNTIEVLMPMFMQFSRISRKA